MRRSIVISAFFLLLAAGVGASAEEGSSTDRAMDKAAGKVDKAMDRMSHAVGMEKWDLKVVEKDRKHRAKPALERGVDGADTVERKTTYHANGKRAMQETRQFVGTSDVVSYIEKNQWDKRGKPLREFRQTCAFDNGVQTSGDGWQKDYQSGKVVHEVKSRWTVDAKDWKDFYTQSTSFYKNGDMKMRTTEETDTNARTRESWGSQKPQGGRNKSTQTWNGEAKRWD